MSGLEFPRSQLDYLWKAIVCFCLVVVVFVDGGYFIETCVRLVENLKMSVKI